MASKFALIGATHPHSLPYLDTLDLTDGIGEILLWDSDQEVLDGIEYKSSRGKPFTKTTDFEAVAGDNSISAALVTLPNCQIPETARKLLEAGKHVLIEKPGATSVEELRPVVTLAEERGLILSICYPIRFHPAALAVREMVDTGVFGRITSFEARWIASQVRFRNPDLWLFKREVAGGGILSWLGCHWIDLLRFWLNDEIVEVAAMTDNLSGEDIDVEDTATVTARFSKGALGTIHVGYHLPISEAGYVGGSYDTFLSLRGTEGNVRWDPKGERADTLDIESVHESWRDEPRKSIRYPVEEKAGYVGYVGWEFMNRFVRAVQTGKEPPTSGRDALNTLSAVEAAYTASRSKRQVSLEAS
jgi:predicted dehydrogenase